MLRVVIDTGVVVSAMLQPFGNSRRALTKALWDCTPIISLHTFGELISVLQRPKFTSKIDESDRAELLELIADSSELVVVTSDIKACRDPDDDLFLNLVIDGRADVLLTRDPDLLVLHPFRDCTITTPTDFLSRF